MLVYYINLIAIVVLAVPLCLWRPATWKKILYLSLTFGYMWFIATFREGIGYDYQSYIDIFEQARAGGQSLGAIFGNLINGGIEPGFYLLNRFLSLFVTSSVVMYGVYSFLMLAPVAYFIFRYCKDVWLSTWIYVTVTFFYTIMNFVRQGMAVSIILLGYKFLREKKTIPFLLLVLLAAMFHKTALIMIPVYFLCHLKLNWKLGLFYAGITLVLYMTSGFIIDFVTDYIFSYYKDSLWVNEGFSITFLFVPVVIFGACLALKFSWEKRDADANMLLNLLLFSLLIWVFITRHFIIERFSMYMYIYAIAAVPAALSALQSPPEVLEKRDALAAQLQGKKTKPSKEQLAALASLNQTISDHQKYYWCAVIAMMIVTFLYHDYGMNSNGFHGVFPYSSVLW
jgi:hypothetical protein